MRIALQFLFCTAAVPLAAYLLPGVTVGSPGVAVLAGASLALLYLVLRPIARLLLGVFNVLTLGLLGLVIDWGLVLLCGYLFPGDLVFESALWALAVAGVADVLRWIGGKVARR